MTAWTDDEPFRVVIFTATGDRVTRAVACTRLFATREEADAAFAEPRRPRETRRQLSHLRNGLISDKRTRR